MTLTSASIEGRGASAIFRSVEPRSTVRDTGLKPIFLAVSVKAPAGDAPTALKLNAPSGPVVFIANRSEPAHSSMATPLSR